MAEPWTAKQAQHKEMLDHLVGLWEATSLKERAQQFATTQLH